MTQSQPPDFTIVTEMAGQRVSAEQVMRTCHRYHWAKPHIKGRDVAELACGAGPGLGLIAGTAKSVSAGDISPDVLARAQSIYGDTIELKVFDAACTPYADRSLDVVLLFEALYYLPDAGAFMREIRRILRPDGKLLVATANKDLFDFTPSKFSVRYYGVVELSELCREHGFTPSFQGYLDTSTVSLRQRMLRPAKFAASRLNLIPKSMAAKENLKKLFFGDMTDMPADVSKVPFAYTKPTNLTAGCADRLHKVIYCAATRERG
jgi:SAM-dependent methyltransferase